MKISNFAWNKYGRFIFSQLSGVFLVGISILGATSIISKYTNDIYGKSIFEVMQDNFSWWSLVIIFIVFILSVNIVFLLWRHILVWLGILTKEQSKGYPYSRPWEQ